MVSFVASAEDLLQWAGIPRRSEENLVGFQRGYNEARVERAKRYFDFPENQSPTALVVGLHPPRGRDPDSIGVAMDGDEDDAIQTCTLTVRYDDTEHDLDDIVESVKRQLDYRLAQANDEDAEQESDEEASLESEDASTDTATADSDEEPADAVDDDKAEESLNADEDGADGDEGEEVEDPDEIELGRSVLHALRAHLEDRDWCAANEEALRDMAKPATLIDGQHRVKGAERQERGIPFAVCALVDCEWSEQVYQFTVVNYTAKGIPDQFITANAALSLTRDELGGLQNRLVQAGVKVIEYELMKVVEFDTRSPFYGLVNLSEKKAEKKIGYKTMVRVAKAWYQGSHPVFQQLLQTSTQTCRAGPNERDWSGGRPTTGVTSSSISGRS